MPSRVNGIGTWYWGRNNIIARNAKCEFCGNAARLTSYDTTLFFTLLFVPLIPLRRKRGAQPVLTLPAASRHPAQEMGGKQDHLAGRCANAWQADRSNAEKADRPSM